MSKGGLVSVNDTIYALATPPGQSAIAIIRISGPKAHRVLIHFGVSNSIVEDKPIAEFRRLKTADGLIIDDVMLVLLCQSLFLLAVAVGSYRIFHSRIALRVLSR